VPAQGTTQVESKASGTIVVFNDYSTSPVKIIKNTRFQTPDGLIFRTPADISVPGKSGTTPGKVTATVTADQTGSQYNIGPTTRFSLPGLKSTAAMYANVYASSNTSMTGGTSGNQPAMAPGAEDAARADIRSRLEAKANQFATGLTNAQTIGLTPVITYKSLPNTSESAGNVTLHEQAHVDVVLLPSDMFAQTIVQTVAAGSDTGPMTFKQGAGFAMKNISASSTIGSDPLTFALSGQATLIWNVDTGALATALAGRDQTAFPTIVAGFPAIQEAHARIEPFWKSTFPQASSIKITVLPPAGN